MGTKANRLVGILFVVGVLLLIPLIAMRFTDEVNWTFFDFAVAAVLLFVFGLLCELALRTVTKTAHRIMIVAVLLGAFLVIWAELAVGIFGTPFAGS